MSVRRPGVLLIDDEPGQIRIVTEVAEAAGFDVLACVSADTALLLADGRRIDLLLADVRPLRAWGPRAVRSLRERYPIGPLVVMADRGDVDGVVEAIGHGASDYLDKPLNAARLRELMIQTRREVERRPMLAASVPPAAHGDFCGMIGRSPAMRELFGLIARVAPRTRSALISGEVGAGKELVARAMHLLGTRRDRAFVAVNCGAADRVSFDGAPAGPTGFEGGTATIERGDLFAVANGGTLFLDQVEALPLTAQARLMRVMETGELYSLGSPEPRRIDVHVLASTSQNLRAAIAAGRFRRDLFLQLAVIELRVPSLEGRREDIPLLAAAFVRECAARIGKGLLGVAGEAEQMLATAAWPGNVRELRNVIERACLLADGDQVTDRDIRRALPAGLRVRRPSTVRAGRPWDGMSPAALAAARERVERALATTGGNKAAAARLLGISRRALYRRLAWLVIAAAPAQAGSAPGLRA